MKLPPSPWYVDPDTRRDMEWNNHILSADGHTVCFMAHNPENNDAHENAARLIGASPDLFEACKRALQYIEASEQLHGHTFGAGNALRAAIAKATGAAQ